MAETQQLVLPSTVLELHAVLSAVAPHQSWEHVLEAGAGFESLGLAQRTAAIRDALLVDLPAKYSDVNAVIDAALDSKEFSGWMIWPVSEALAIRATAGNDDDFRTGLDLIAKVSPRLTSEFALRYFLRVNLDKTLRQAEQWAQSGDASVRRLASEGTRPRLPWAKQVPELFTRPGVTRPILDQLRRDPSETVRRSVANHLNDISRDHPKVALNIAEGWAERPEPYTQWVIRHGMRTLIKRGEPRALRLLGYGDSAALTITGPTLDVTQLAVGDTLGFDGEVVNNSDSEVRVAVDFVIHFVKANGSLSPKVFKLTNSTIPAGNTLKVRHTHSLRQLTTRRYYSGEHALELQVNGTRFGRTPFTLQTKGEA